MTCSTLESRAGRSARSGTSKGTPASASVRFARTMRCCTVGNRHQQRAGDLLGREAGDGAQRQGQARLGGQHGVAGDEDEPQHVVVDAIGVAELGHGVALLLDRARRRRAAARAR